MLRTIKAAAAVVLACGLFAGGVQAAPIVGTVGVGDGMTGAPFLPCSPTSIVGDCSSLSPAGPGDTSGGTLDFAGSNGLGNATILAWVFANPGGTTNEICIPGFCFDILSVTLGPTKTPLVCSDGTCGDTLSMNIRGVVTGAGFDPTIFTGTLTLNGSCTNASATACTSDSVYSGRYNYTLASTGRPFQTPEPGTLALLGIAFLGIGAARRRMR